jgi:hypothetical protein
MVGSIVCFTGVPTSNGFFIIVCQAEARKASKILPTKIIVI